MAVVPLAAVLALASPAAEAQRFEDRSRVVEVQIPINVVDRDGNPIRGLTAEDFEILDEGKRQQITHLEVIDLEALEVTGGRKELEEAVPSGARRHFLLLFDLSFSSPTSIGKARDAAREFVLNNLHPTDLVAVATYTLEQGPRLLVTFTPDRSQLASAIDNLGGYRQQDLIADPLRFLVEPPRNSGMDSSSTSLGRTAVPIANYEEAAQSQARVIAKSMSKMENSYLRGRITIWSRSLGEMARILDSVKGRKHVVYFSEGFDGRLLLGRQPDANDQNLQEDMYNLQFGQYWMVDTDDIYGNNALQHDVADMLEQFRRADCVIQAVDISGLRADSPATERQRRVGQDALFYVANETGGELFEDANNLGRQLERVLSRSAVTYLVTFQPQELEWDGSYHRLKVKADLPRGARLSHREGYYAPRPFDELHPLEKSLLASGAIAAAQPSAELTLDVLAAPFRAGAGVAYVPVIIELAGRPLLDGHDKDELKVEFYAYVTDDFGEMRDFFTQLVSLDISRGRQALLTSGLKYYGHLELDPGDYLVRVLARNADTGRTGVKSVSVSVPSYDAANPVLLPPFFHERPGSWVLVRERQSDGESRVVYPFTIDGEPYIPAASPVMAPGDVAELCVVAYNLGDGELELDGQVVAADGTVMAAGRLDMIKRTVTGIDGLDKLRARFSVAGLESGDYTLQVAVVSPGTGERQVNSVPFSVLD